MNEEIKLEYIHLCDYASPAQNGKLNLLGIFESFLAVKAPDFYVVARISVKPNTEYKISFEIQSEENNKKIFINDTPIVTPPSPNIINIQVIKPFKNVDFQNFGKYKFIILVNDLPVGVKLIEVGQKEVKVN